MPNTSPLVRIFIPAYQLWFRHSGGGSGVFADVTLQRGVAYVDQATGQVCEVWVPAYDAAFNAVFSVRGTACRTA